MSSSEPKCITCGLPLGRPPRLNTLGNGLPCPTCVERLLAELPPLLPGAPSPAPEPVPSVLPEEDEEPDYDPAV